MGQHWVPQEYLRSFETSPGSGLIWVFDKVSGEAKSIPIKATAQAEDYYDRDVETQLAVVEGPAHAILQDSAQISTLSSEKRHVLACYIAVMLYRGPKRRRKGEDLVPSVMEETIGRLKAELEEVARDLPADDANVERWRKDIDATALKLRSTIPKEVQDSLRQPWPSEQVFRIIAQKSWRLLVAKDSDRFVTADSPAFFFEGFGLGNPASELTFPLTPTLALIADHQGEPFSTTSYRVTNVWVREVNRRVVSGAERFVFSHAEQRWVAAVAAKTHPYLSRVEWSGRLKDLR